MPPEKGVAEAEPSLNGTLRGAVQLAQSGLRLLLWGVQALRPIRSPGQGDLDPCAASYLARDHDGPVLSLDQRFGDREPQTTSPASPRPVNNVKAVEDPRQVLRWDPLTRVGNHQADHSIVWTCCQANLAASRRVAQSIIQEDQQDLAQSLRVGDNHRVGWLDNQSDRALVGEPSDLASEISEERGERYGRQREREPTSVQP